ncbi:MAG: hypothetical protein IPH88_14735 [Bacteroidales bacterium]|nr:hypothetical protein [Bacteroidales bacterium]
MTTIIPGRYTLKKEGQSCIDKKSEIRKKRVNNTSGSQYQTLNILDRNGLRDFVKLMNAFQHARSINRNMPAEAILASYFGKRYAPNATRSMMNITKIPPFSKWWDALRFIRFYLLRNKDSSILTRTFKLQISTIIA